MVIKLGLYILKYVIIDVRNTEIKIDIITHNICNMDIQLHFLAK